MTHFITLPVLQPHFILLQALTYYFFLSLHMVLFGMHLLCIIVHNKLHRNSQHQIFSFILISIKQILFIFFKFYFIFKLYIIVLVLPNIKMNLPQVYMCSPQILISTIYIPLLLLWNTSLLTCSEFVLVGKSLTNSASNHKGFHNSVKYATEKNGKQPKQFIVGDG